MSDTPEVLDNTPFTNLPITPHETLALIAGEIMPIEPCDDEIRRQQLTVMTIAVIMLNDSIPLDSRHRAIAELRSGSDYKTLEWRSLHMFAVHATRKFRTHIN